MTAEGPRLGPVRGRRSAAGRLRDREPGPQLAQGVADLSWLTVDTPTHVEARTDQYVAAFRYARATRESFSTAYMVRAVSPGKFVLPGATVEDMYRPELRANTDPGTLEIGTPGSGPAAGKAPAALNDTNAPAASSADAPVADSSSSSAAN